MLDEPVDLDGDDLPQVLAVERVEDDRFVDAVEELGQELGTERGADRLANFFLAAPFVGDLLDQLAADVRRHDDDRVGEIDGAAVAVGQAAVVENLQQDVEDVAMGLFDFVQQHDAIGTAADGLGQPAPFFVADIAWRSADQAADGVAFHELAHVDPDHGVFVVEQDFGQRLAKFGFADAGRAQKDERADRPVGVLQAGSAAADGVGDGGRRLRLGR